MSAELIASFQSITGLNDTTKCKKFINDAHGNLELALSNYFDSGAIPPEDLHPSVFQAPIPQQDAMQIEIDEPEEDPEPLAVAPALYPSKAIDKPLPIQGVNIKAQILNFMANIELTQRFVNDSKNPIEAVFQFQQYDSALHGFEVEVDGKIYKGAIKSKQKALEAYDDTIASGHGAYLLEKDKTREDVYRINVGNLPPGKEATLRIYYLTELETEGDDLRLILPATRTKVYSKSEQIREQDKARNAISGVSVHIDVNMSHDLVQITSPSHQIDVQLDGKKGTIDLKPDQDQKGRAMVILIKMVNPHNPLVTVEKYKSTETNGSEANNTEKKRPAHEIEREEKRKKHNAVMVSFFPKVEIQDDPVCEIIFLVDRSGSMAGSRMNQTKNALQIFLRSLPVGTKFNIVGFGDTYEKLFPSSVFFDDRSLNTATNHVLNMQSNLIGTNILPPLRDILTREADPEFPRQVFCLTDGEVKNTEEVLQFVKDNARGCRVFTFGIGADASKALVLGIAKYGHGKAEFIRSGERIEPVVMRQLKRALQPVLRDVSIEWGSLPVAERKASYDIPPIFDGDKLVISTFLDDASVNNSVEDQSAKSEKITITAKSGAAQFEWRADVDLTHSIEGEMAHKLCATKLIRDYEKNNLKKEIADLGLVWGLVSSQTSYIAVETRKEATEGNMETIDVNAAVKSFGAENSEVIQIEAVQRRMSIGGKADRPVPSDAMELDEQVHHQELGSAQKSARRGGFFASVSNLFKKSSSKAEPVKSTDAKRKRKSGAVRADDSKGRGGGGSRGSHERSAPVEDKYQYYRNEEENEARSESDHSSDDEAADDLAGGDYDDADVYRQAEQLEKQQYGMRSSSSFSFGAAPIVPSAQPMGMSYAQPQLQQQYQSFNYMAAESYSAPIVHSLDDQPEAEMANKSDMLSDINESMMLDSFDGVGNDSNLRSSSSASKKGQKDSEKKKEKEDKNEKKQKKEKADSTKFGKPISKKNVAADKQSEPRPNETSSATTSVNKPLLSPRKPIEATPGSMPMTRDGTAPPPPALLARSNSSSAPPPPPGPMSPGGMAPPSPKGSVMGAPSRPAQELRGPSSGPGQSSEPKSSSSLVGERARRSLVAPSVDPVLLKQMNSAQRPLDRLVLAAAANGSFTAENIAAALNLDVTRVNTALPALLAAIENSLVLWATAIALTYLESRESNSRDEWDLIGGKAKKFLTRALSATPNLVDQLLAEANKFLSNI